MTPDCPAYISSSYCTVPGVYVKNTLRFIGRYDISCCCREPLVCNRPTVRCTLATQISAAHSLLPWEWQAAAPCEPLARRCETSAKCENYSSAKPSASAIFCHRIRLWLKVVIQRHLYVGRSAEAVISTFIRPLVMTIEHAYRFGISCDVGKATSRSQQLHLCLQL